MLLRLKEFNLNEFVVAESFCVVSSVFVLYRLVNLYLLQHQKPLCLRNSLFAIPRTPTCGLAFVLFDLKIYSYCVS